MSRSTGLKSLTQALLDIGRTVEHLPSAWGMQYLSSLGGTREDLQIRLEHSYADVFGEYIMIWAVLMLLTSSRKAVDYQPVDRSKLNRARVKRRQVPLFD